MRLRKVGLLTVAFTCGVLQGWSQSIDQKKMDKDITIAEDILMSMQKNSSEDFHFHSNKPKGMFVPEYGVIFNLSAGGNNHLDRIHVISDDDFDFDFDFDFSDSFHVNVEEITERATRMANEALKHGQYNRRIVIEQELQEEAEELRREAQQLQKEAQEMQKEAEVMAREAEKEARKAEKKMIKKSEKQEQKKEREEEVDTDVQVIVTTRPDRPVRPVRPVWRFGGSRLSDEEYRAVMSDFLVDYAALIGQIDPEHKIMVTTGSPKGRSSEDTIRQITAELSKAALNQYKNGSISREALVSKIEFTEKVGEQERGKDLELLSTIIERLYKKDLSDTYFVSEKIGFQRLDRFGAIYSMKTYSSNSYSGKYCIPTLDLEDLSLEERNKKVEMLYPKFEKGLKENILDYGKTLKSLSPSETVLFQVKLTECKGCNMPENIDLSVKQSVLSDYDSGKLSKSAALAKVTLKKY